MKDEQVGISRGYFSFRQDSGINNVLRLSVVSGILACWAACEALELARHSGTLSWSSAFGSFASCGPGVGNIWPMGRIRAKKSFDLALSKHSVKLMKCLTKYSRANF